MVTTQSTNLIYQLDCARTYISKAIRLYIYIYIYIYVECHICHHVFTTHHAIAEIIKLTYIYVRIEYSLVSRTYKSSVRTHICFSKTSIFVLWLYSCRVIDFVFRFVVNEHIWCETKKTSL